MVRVVKPEPAEEIASASPRNDITFDR